MGWVIEYYVMSNGREIVKEFIDRLQKTDQAKFAHNLDLLERYGYSLGMPHAKPLGKGLMELRIRSGRGGQEIRIFYTIAEQYRIYLLHGFIKKTQATPR